MSKYIGAVIADIHIGAIHASEMYNQISQSFLNKLRDMDRLDFIVICGDYFHNKLYLNTLDAEICIRIMNEIYQIAMIKNAKVRIVYGTESHEVKQYHIFDDIERNSEGRFKVIYGVSEEEIFPDVWVLYLPEEVMMDKKEFYSDYFSKSKKYSYIFGHGVIQEVMTDAVRHTDSNKNRAKVPSFTTAELNKMCKGECFFGHYHIHTVIQHDGDKCGIYYIGSFTRWRYGESEEKGYYITECNPEKDKFKSTFIENVYAEKYITKAYGYEHPIFSSQDEFVKELDSVDYTLKTDPTSHVRILLNIPENLSWANFAMEYVKNKYAMNDRVKINIVNGYVEKRDMIDKEQIDNLISEYEFIFDRSIPIENKCSQFIKLVLGSEITPARIKDIIDNDLRISED